MGGGRAAAARGRRITPTASRSSTGRAPAERRWPSGRAERDRARRRAAWRGPIAGSSGAAAGRPIGRRRRRPRSRPPGLGRRDPLVAVVDDHLGAREEEAEHQVGGDPVDDVAVDERGALRHGRPSASSEQRDPDVAQEDELAGRAGQGAARIEAGHRRHLAASPGTARRRARCRATGRGRGRPRRSSATATRMSSSATVSAPAARGGGAVERDARRPLRRAGRGRPRGRRAAVRLRATTPIATPAAP